MPSPAELSVTKQMVASHAALTAVQAAVAKGQELGRNVCAAVAAPDGSLVALWRTADVVLPAIDYAVDKAYTAATLGTSTQALFERADSRPALKQGLTNRKRVLVFPGGLPIVVDGVVLGGIGVSGATDEEDVVCAQAALSALGVEPPA